MINILFEEELGDPEDDIKDRWNDRIERSIYGS